MISASYFSVAYPQIGSLYSQCNTVSMLVSGTFCSIQAQHFDRIAMCFTSAGQPFVLCKLALEDKRNNSQMKRNTSSKKSTLTALPKWSVDTQLKPKNGMLCRLWLTAHPVADALARNQMNEKSLFVGHSVLRPVPKNSVTIPGSFEGGTLTVVKRSFCRIPVECFLSLLTKIVIVSSFSLQKYTYVWMRSRAFVHVNTR